MREPKNKQRKKAVFQLFFEGKWNEEQRRQLAETYRTTVYTISSDLSDYVRRYATPQEQLWYQRNARRSIILNQGHFDWQDRRAYFASLLESYVLTDNDVKAFSRNFRISEKQLKVELMDWYYFVATPDERYQVLTNHFADKQTREQAILHHLWNELSLTDLKLQLMCTYNLPKIQLEQEIELCRRKAMHLLQKKTIQSTEHQRLKKQIGNLYLKQDPSPDHVIRLARQFDISIPTFHALFNEWYKLEATYEEQKQITFRSHQNRLSRQKLYHSWKQDQKTNHLEPENETDPRSLTDWENEYELYRNFLAREQTRLDSYHTIQQRKNTLWNRYQTQDLFPKDFQQLAKELKVESKLLEREWIEVLAAADPVKKAQIKEARKQNLMVELKTLILDPHSKIKDIHAFCDRYHYDYPLDQVLLNVYRDSNTYTPEEKQILLKKMMEIREEKKNLLTKVRNMTVPKNQLLDQLVIIETVYQNPKQCIEWLETNHVKPLDFQNVIQEAKKNGVITDTQWQQLTNFSKKYETIHRLQKIKPAYEMILHQDYTHQDLKSFDSDLNRLMKNICRYANIVKTADIQKVKEAMYRHYKEYDHHTGSKEPMVSFVKQFGDLSTCCHNEGSLADKVSFLVQKGYNITDFHGIVKEQKVLGLFNEPEQLVVEQLENQYEMIYKKLQEKNHSSKEPNPTSSNAYQKQLCKKK